jgi:hypothetical protein
VPSARKSSRQSTPVDADSGASHVETTAPATDLLLRIALVAGLGWYSFLGYLIAAVQPVTLNVRQIAESDAIVRASVGVKGGVKVIKVWRGNVDTEELGVVLPEDVSRPGEFIIPLRRTATGWEITPTRVAEGIRLVYPATEQSVEKLAELLRHQEEVGT